MYGRKKETMFCRKQTES